MILLATGSKKAVDPSDAKEIPWKHGLGTKKIITRNVVVFSAFHHRRSKGDLGRASDLVATRIGSSWRRFLSDGSENEHDSIRPIGKVFPHIENGAGRERENTCRAETGTRFVGPPCSPPGAASLHQKLVEMSIQVFRHPSTGFEPTPTKWGPILRV
jgi:hypothetical protein